jgi:hypothetical protein
MPTSVGAVWLKEYTTLSWLSLDLTSGPVGEYNKIKEVVVL